MTDIPCPHCGQANEPQREVCWECFRLLRPKDAPTAQSDIPGGIPAPPPERSALGSFGVTRTMSTRITINGKEYDRMEDVPEQFQPKLKFAFGAAHRTLETDGPVPLPDGFRFEDIGMERRVSLRWFSLGIIGALIFVALWDGVLGFVIQGALSVKNPPLSGLLVLLILGAVGVGMAYAVIAYLFNRTSVRVDAARVSVGHGPVPWFGARVVPRADIARVWSEKVGRESDDDTMFEPSVTYRVRVLLKGGRTLNLVTGLRAPEQALFLEQQIRKS